MSSATRKAATLDDLHRVDGKAELIDGRVVRGMPPAAEAEMAARRADDFEAGTLVVWDVDPIHELVRKYLGTRHNAPDTYTRGQDADAEPAVPGWRMAVDRAFA